jgi:hypothetical protein
MNRQSEIKCSYFLVLLISLLFLLPCANSVTGAEIPTAWDVASRKAELPTIEDLTAGKVKKGDVIDKTNVDLVKQYLSAGVLEAVNQGMKMIMGSQMPPDSGIPETSIEATERNKGKAVMDENGTVYYEKIGTPWLGGIPFPEPKSGLEVMANKKFGAGVDDYFIFSSIIFVNQQGKSYKKVMAELQYLFCSTRTELPPFGTYPGYEDIMYKRTSILVSPLEVKGFGQYSVRYYDDSKNYDTGFAYFPAYKRTLRISATTWQDNVAGSDLTYGDGNGFQEPYSVWSFNLLGTQYILMAEPKAPFPLADDNGICKGVILDVGEKYPRIGWAITPIHVVEAIPKVSHIYGKRILYIVSAPYFNPDIQVVIADNYDRQMKLWKVYLSFNGDYNEREHYYMQYGCLMNDLQTGHMTQYWSKMHLNKGLKPGDISLKELTAKGR